MIKKSGFLLGHCPSCGSGFSANPFNRNGWYYAECGRRRHRKFGWEPTEPIGCVRRQLNRALAEAWRLGAALLTIEKQIRAVILRVTKGS
jgi:hypothetical protein